MSGALLEAYALDRWTTPRGEGTAVRSAIDGVVLAEVSSEGIPFEALVAFGREQGGPNLRRLTFFERAVLLRSLAEHLAARTEELYRLSYHTGATKRDHAFDVDGGIATLFVYASRGRRELPHEHFLLDGGYERLSRGGSFGGRHLLVPRRGVAVQINAYNFPCWGMLEKFAPAFLAGVPTIVKPATPTAYVTHALAREIVASGLLPPGALQFVAGGARDLLEQLDGRDSLAFTGSAATSQRLRDHPTISREAVRFVAERDSLNAAVLGPDAHPGSPEFGLFVDEVVRELTVKAGQKCTAIRRAFVPAAFLEAAEAALAARLREVVVGDPRDERVTMGPLVSLAQRDDVRSALDALLAEGELAFGDPERVAPLGADATLGGYLAPLLVRAREPAEAHAVHEIEAFGPVATLIPYETLDQAIDLVRRGAGSLVASIYTYDDEIAEELTFGLASEHGRLVLIDRDCARESSGHGAPPALLLHGGPGRAGGGEELGGLRSLGLHLQRSAISGAPGRIAQLARRWERGAPERPAGVHPFRLFFEELEVGASWQSGAREITLDDIEHFAHFTGDTFYAHMDEEAARANPLFGGRVAHGYLVLAFAAGLFVDPAPGPVLANYGLERLRFTQPVKPGDTIAARLTVAQRTPRTPEQGEVRWDVAVRNQRDELVASYELLTLCARTQAPPREPATLLRG